MYSIKSKKGMKFNKLTHLSIIVVLAIVFIVVYLYYTISDVKKIHNEVSKLTNDITQMNASISNITSTLSAMLVPQPATCASVGGGSGGVATVCSLPQGAQSIPQPPLDDEESSVNAQELQAIIETIEDEDEGRDTVQPVQEQSQVPTQKTQFVVYENDVANLDDLKDVEELMAQPPQTLKDAPKLLDITTIGNVNEPSSGVVEDLSKLSLDELKSVAYDTIRKYCKNNGLNYKGSKDVLIYRIKGVTA